jgi:hypothetical protein
LIISKEKYWNVMAILFFSQCLNIFLSQGLSRSWLVRCNKF